MILKLIGDCELYISFSCNQNVVMRDKSENYDKTFNYAATQENEAFE